MQSLYVRNLYRIIRDMEIKPFRDGRTDVSSRTRRLGRRKKQKSFPNSNPSRRRSFPLVCSFFADADVDDITV